MNDYGGSAQRMAVSRTYIRTHRPNRQAKRGRDSCERTCGRERPVSPSVAGPPTESEELRSLFAAYWSSALAASSSSSCIVPVYSSALISPSRTDRQFRTHRSRISVLMCVEPRLLICQ